jgi:hypothetical protein
MVWNFQYPQDIIHTVDRCIDSFVLSVRYSKKTETHLSERRHTLYTRLIHKTTMAANAKPCILFPTDLNSFHTAVKHFLMQRNYVGLPPSSHAVPSSSIDYIKKTIHAINNGAIVIQVINSTFILNKEPNMAKDQLVFITYNQHITSLKYVTASNTVLFFDPHGVCPSDVVDRVINNVFPSCKIFFSSKQMQGAHGVCSLWAIWFCLVMSCINPSLESVMKSNVDDTYMMCLNNLLWSHGTKTVTSDTRVKPTRTITSTFDVTIAKTSNVIADVHQLMQRGIAGSPMTRIWYAQISNLENTFRRVYQQLRTLRTTIGRCLSVQQLKELLDACENSIVEEFNQMENALIQTRNCDCFFMSSGFATGFSIQIEGLRSVRKLYQTTHETMKDSLSQFPSDMAIN